MADATEKALRQYKDHEDPSVANMARLTLQAYKSVNGEAMLAMQRAIKEDLQEPEAIKSALRVALSTFSSHYVDETRIAEKPSPRRLTELGMSRYEINGRLPKQIADHVQQRAQEGDDRMFKELLAEAVEPYTKRATRQSHTDMASRSKGRVTERFG